MTLKIVALIDSFKDSIDSETIVKQVREIFPSPSTYAFPVSDGGEGFVNAMAAAQESSASITTMSSFNALGKAVQAVYLYDSEKKCVVFESASCAGIQDVPLDQRNPHNVSSFGIGKQIEHFLLQIHPQDTKTKDIITIIIGLGGTATVDCGYGLLHALGVDFYDKNDELLTNPYDVQLDRIARIDTGRMNVQLLHHLQHVQFQLAADVTNPLLGKNGASYIFGPQKGLRVDQLEQYDQKMAHCSAMLEKWCQVPISLKNEEGMGAAGGIGYALRCLPYIIQTYRQNYDKNHQITPVLSCETSPLPLAAAPQWPQVCLQSGFSLLMQHTHISDMLHDADLIITGEGSFDFQSLQGKVVGQLIDLQSQHNNQPNPYHPDKIIPLIVLCGISSFSYSKHLDSSIIFDDRDVSSQVVCSDKKNIGLDGVDEDIISTADDSLPEFANKAINALLSINIDYPAILHTILEVQEQKQQQKSQPQQRPAPDILRQLQRELATLSQQGNLLPHQPIQQTLAQGPANLARSLMFIRDFFIPMWFS